MYGLEHGFSLDDGLGEIAAFPDFRSYDFSGLSEEVPSNGQAGPAVVVQQPNLIQKAVGFLTSSTGLLLLAGLGFYLYKYKRDYLEEVTEKAKGLLENLGDEKEGQEESQE